MPNENYILLERTELNASAASVTFSNIPQSGYTDLKIVTSARGTASLSSGYVDGIITFNGSTTGYSERMVYGIGSSAGSLSQSSTGIKWNFATSSVATASTFGNSEAYIPNYTSSNNKSVSIDTVAENNSSTVNILALNAGLWSNTAAITSITITAGSGSFVANSTFSLYGIAAVGTTPVIAPKASGGNIIDYDGTYWIHTFLTSGTFTPQTGLTCDYLVVAGGAGGGASVGSGYGGAGGGGAGGLRSTVTATGGGGSLESAISVASGTPIAVTIGAGGAGAASDVRGTNGSDSIFSTVTSTGGGGGGTAAAGFANKNGAAGGSGGGGAYISGTGGARTTNQGFAGGSTTGDGGAGGGGAGAVGSNTSTASGGNGGNGVATSITGSSVTYGGGGGGGAYLTGNGTGGSGGGGNGGTNAGTVNRGAGGGGGTGLSGGGLSGGNGGSGIVIIRYPAA
jgi:hypothetical protein